MQMETSVICSEYRQAKDKQKQIRVLADLNVCSTREIACILRDNGEQLPAYWAAKLQQPAKPRKAKAQEPVAEESTVSIPEPEAGTGITVGKLKELLNDVPDETPVMLDKQTGVERVTFTRIFDSGKGAIRDELMLSPF